MRSRDFCYWLQGFFELRDKEPIQPAQIEIIQRHLAMVFAHEIDPTFGDKKHQDILDALHRPPADGTLMRC
jgi:hypothetical protein